MPDDEGDETSLVSAKDSKWKFRPPPRGVAKEALKLCQEVGEGSTGVCEMQENCVQAHSLEELEEWSERREGLRRPLGTVTASYYRISAGASSSLVIGHNAATIMGTTLSGSSTRTRTLETSFSSCKHCLSITM